MDFREHLLRTDIRHLAENLRTLSEEFMLIESFIKSEFEGKLAAFVEARGQVPEKSSKKSSMYRRMKATKFEKKIGKTRRRSKRRKVEVVSSERELSDEDVEDEEQTQEAQDKEVVVDDSMEFDLPVPDDSDDEIDQSGSGNTHFDIVDEMESDSTEQEDESKVDEVEVLSSSNPNNSLSAATKEPQTQSSSGGEGLEAANKPLKADADNEVTEARENGTDPKSQSEVPASSHINNGQEATEKTEILNPKQCRYCGVICRDMARLTDHERKHTKERPFGCPICGKNFVRQDIVNRHMRNIHGTDNGAYRDQLLLRQKLSARTKRAKNKDIRYDCHLCHKSFNRPDSVRRHLKLHTNEKDLKCPHCTYAASRADHLKLHVERAHIGKQDLSS